MPLIAVCDILGFSRLVSSRPLNEVVHVHLGYVRRSLFGAIHQSTPPTEIPSLAELQHEAHIGFDWFSDTMLFYSREETAETYRRIIDTLGWLLFFTVVFPTGRIRAGVSFGEAFLDPEERVYVGPALIEAYRLEQAQLWSGGALSESARAVVQHPHEWLVSYEVPILQPNGVRTTYRTSAINWAFGGHRREDYIFPWPGQGPEPGFREYMSQPDVVEKWRNTRRFHEEVCDRCRR